VYPGTFYGTLRSEIDRIWNRGNHVIFDVDVEGGLNIKQHFGDRALLVFVMPPSIEVLTERLRNRATETEKSFVTRVSKATREMEYARHADRILVNDKLSESLPNSLVMINEFLEAP
jgi:guanylate kinase